jgi:O-antigen/teichoic acid export membrane protein
MDTTQRIVFNTAATYTRTVLATGLALFSNRWVLNALGEVDYGLFSVVGSLIIFIVFLNSVMAASVGRHYAFAIGKGAQSEVIGWFNSALSIHLFFAAALTLIGWPIGEYIIDNVLNIPNSRVPACLGVFRVSLISAFFSMISIPFVAMFTAKQHIAELAVWGLLQTILAFILALGLRYAHGDRLMFYAIGMVTILVFIQVSQIIRAIAVFRECTIEREQLFDKNRLRQIFSFASWNLIGSLGAILRNQGSAILLNLYFGPRLNATFGIANQVSSNTNRLAAAMMGAFMPEITTSEGRGDRSRMLDLSLRACKFGTLLVLILAVPLMVEIDYVLKVWLINPPIYASLFCQFMLCTFLIDRLSAGYMMAVNAYGRIAAYQATLGTILVFTLPLAWLFLYMGFSPPSVAASFIVTMSIVSVGRVLWIRYLFGIPVKNWVDKVLTPCFIVGIASTIGSFVPRCCFEFSFVRFFLATLFSLMASLFCVWFFALDSKERIFLAANIKQFFSRAKSLLYVS